MASKHATYFLPKMQWEWLLKERPHTRSGVQKRSTKVMVTGDWMGTRLFPPSTRIAKTHKWSHKQMTSWWQQHVLVGFTCTVRLPAFQVFANGRCLFRCSDLETMALFSGRWGTIHYRDIYSFFLHYGISYFFSKPKLCPIAFATEFLVLDKFTQQLHGC